MTITASAVGSAEPAGYDGEAPFPGSDRPPLTVGGGSGQP